MESVIVASIPSSLPPHGLWLMFSPRALFHDRAGWPTLRRHRPSDVRIMNLLDKLRTQGAAICFYQLHAVAGSPSWMDIPPLITVEVVNPSYSGRRFLPSWLGYRPNEALENSSIVYVYLPAKKEES